ncbi:MAG: ferredoxin--NADP reductase [Candidatus Thiodiazotropha sp.]
MDQWLEGEVVEKRHWCDKLYSLRVAADVDPFTAGQFTRLALEVDGERIARPYSFVNTPGDQLLEIHFNEVQDGPLSPRLASLEPGDRVWVSAQAKGLFTLDQIPDAQQLWMIASGTALGVYLSILRTEAAWSRFETLVLVHNVRWQGHLCYAEEIKQIKTRYAERFRYLPILSQETVPGMLQGRVLGALQEGRLEAQAGLTLSPEHSHVMLCGNMGMIREVSQALEERGMRKHRRQEPGHYSTEKYH